MFAPATMKATAGSRNFLFCLLALLLHAVAGAQLCTGSLGDPVVHITFGAGTNPGPQLDNNNYIFYNQDCPNDGQYTIRNRTDGCFGRTWHQLNSDHTGDPGGYFMLVNASFQPGDFYRSTVRNLCGNTTYEFAAWVVNMMNTTTCGGGTTIKSNLTFSIETTGGTVLATYNTGDIDITNRPEWKQYGMFFTTPANVSEVLVRLRNNAPGGCGNDLALDDITFRPCGATINAAIDGVSGDSVAVCAGDAASYRLSAVVNSAYQNPQLQWQESADNGANWQSIPGATTNQYVWSGKPAGRYQYRLLVAERGNINSTACRVASKPVTIRVNARPLVHAGDFAQVCNNSIYPVHASLQFPDSTGGTYQWQLPLGLALSFTEGGTAANRQLQANVPVSGNAAGLYRLTATSGAGCVASDTFSLALLARPVATVQVPRLSCATELATYRGAGSLNGGSIDAWWWQLTGPEDSATGTDFNFAYRFNTPGSRLLRLVVTGSNGCTSDTVSATVDIRPMPVPDFKTPEVCLSDPFAQFQNTSSIEGNEPLSYRWSFGDPLNASAGAIVQDPRYRYTRTGVYPVTLVAISAAGCVADTVKPFTVNGAAPRAAFSLGNTAVLCSADSVVLLNNASVDFGNITRLEIRWNNSNDPATTTVDEEPVSGKRYAFRYQPLITAPSQTFTIRMTAFSGIGCVNEVSQTVTVNRSPQVAFDSLSSLCANATPFLLNGGREFTGSAGSGGYTGPGVSPNGLFNPALAGPGLHPVRYRFAAANGCIADSVRTLQVWPVPQVSAGPDQAVILGGTVTLAATATGVGLQYAWSPAQALTSATILQPGASPPADQDYRLAVTSANGCVAFDTVKVTVINELYVPTAFTPNGDGLNDTWQVPYLASARDVLVRVFNRYGQVVFESRGSNRWDGRFKGLALPNGAYVYLLQYNGRRQQGTVMLIR